MSADQDRPITVLVVMGVSGSGKTTLAKGLSEALGWPMQEGDFMHSEANRAKMASGTPLTDADRWPWLYQVRAWIDEHLATGQPGVITCSALKRRYRDLLRAPGVVFVLLAGDRETIMERLRNRVGHYMPPVLLDSQLETLEEFAPEEDSVVVNIGQSPQAEVDEVLDQLGDRAQPLSGAKGRPR